MDSNSTEPKKFSYPNSDRPSDDHSGTSELESRFKPKPDQKAIKETIHINDALKNEGLQKPADLQNIRTFQSDVANAVKTDNVSLIKIALAEKKRQERQGTYDSTLNIAQSPNKILIIGVISITLLFAAGGFFVWSAYSKTTPTEKPTDGASTLATPPFEAEQVAIIDVRDKDFNDAERLVEAEKTGERPSGSIKRIRFVRTNDLGVKQDLSAQEWLTFFQTEAQGSLIRAFDPGFIFGIFSTKADSFIIFKVNSYDNAYAGMLQWEPTMESDIGNLISNKDISTENIGSSTPIDLLKGRPFVDKVINNKDSRVLLTDSGKTKIIYSFIDQNTLVIASSETVLREVVFRLTTGRISR